MQRTQRRGIAGGLGAAAGALLLFCLSSPAQQQQRPPQGDASQATWSPLRQVNEQLPAWLQFSGEYRLRFESHDAYGFRSGDNDSYLLSRLRLALTLQPASWFRVHAEGQDARAGGIDPVHVGSSLKDTLDLRQLYIELKAEGIARLTVGRQEMVYGAKRLVGNGNWSNSARVFDAARLSLGRDGARLDVFAAAAVINKVDEFDNHRPGENFRGMYGSFGFIPKATFEPYVLWRTLPRVNDERGHAGNADIYTTGFRLAGTLPAGFDYAAEIARQNGEFSSDRVAAWAGYGIAGYSLPKRRWKPRFSAECDYATGDRALGDGEINTFDQLYPTNHAFYGIADLAGWRNIKALRTGVELKPRQKLGLTLDYLFFWLASARDGLYADNGALSVAAPKPGARHGDVGRELDLFAAYSFRPAMTFGAGISHLFPGRFLKETTPGAAVTYPYVMAEYRF